MFLFSERLQQMYSNKNNKELEEEDRKNMEILRSHIDILMFANARLQDWTIET